MPPSLEFEPNLQPHTSFHNIILLLKEVSILVSITHVYTHLFIINEYPGDNNDDDVARRLRQQPYRRHHSLHALGCFFKGELVAGYRE